MCVREKEKGCGPLRTAWSHLFVLFSPQSHHVMWRNILDLWVFRFYCFKLKVWAKLFKYQVSWLLKIRKSITPSLKTIWDGHCFFWLQYPIKIASPFNSWASVPLSEIITLKKGCQNQQNWYLQRNKQKRIWPRSPLT